MEAKEHAPHCAFSGAWFGVIPPECTCGGESTISRWPTFQDFAVDNADRRLTLDTNASTPRPSGSNAGDANPMWGAV